MRKVYLGILHENGSFKKAKRKEPAQKLLNRCRIGGEIRKRRADRSFGDKK
jgi:hypothetical protein